MQTPVAGSSETSTEKKLDLEVTGIPEKITKEHISLYFENEKKTGGGAISNINFDSETGTAIISFQDKLGKFW